MTMYEEASSGKTNLSPYLKYQASALTEVSKFHQGERNTQSPWVSFSFLLLLFCDFWLAIFFFFPHYPASSLLPTAVAQGFGHKTNSCTYRGCSRYLSRRNIQVFGIFCQHSHVRIESAHSRSYVILMSFLLWVTEKNLSALFCYLLGV